MSTARNNENPEKGAPKTDARENAALDNGVAEEIAGLDAREILAVVDAAARDHMTWLHQFHLSIICGKPPPRNVISDQARYLCGFGAWVDLHRKDSLVTQAAFQVLIKVHDQMHDDASFLAEKALQGQSIKEREYEILAEKVTSFYGHAWRIQEAFHRAHSDLDPLTGIYNRRVMLVNVARERERFLRTGVPCCVALADLDHFKKINDSHGHAVGDQVLLACALRFIESLRPYDTVFRYGGEEFLMCLPDADTATAFAIMERLRSEISGAPIPCGSGEGVGGKNVSLTLSFGVAGFDADTPLKGVIKRADEALFRAKRAGRDRGCVFEDDDGAS